jgi:DNA-binding NtrC family response regulator
LPDECNDVPGARNATQALRIIHRLDARLVLLVSDIMMPGDMSGLDLAHSVRIAFPDLPIVLISGYVEMDAMKDSGFNFLRKPFTPDTILNAVRQAIQR